MSPGPTKPRMSPEREAALDVLKELVEARARLDRIQAAMREEWTELRGMSLPGKIEVPTVRLIDEVLGKQDGFGLGSYLLYECLLGGGGRIEVQGRSYTIRTVDDLRTYLEREVPEPPR